MLCYKLFKVRKNGTIGPLFINRKQVLPIGEWLEAEDHPTKGYAHRPGWHCTTKPEAPHLSMKGRKWFEVEITNYETLTRPESQGGTWYLAKWIKINHELQDNQGLSFMSGLDQAGDQPLPVPETTQGIFVPKMIKSCKK